MAPSHLVLIVLLSEANLAPLNQGRDGPFLQGPSLLNETQRHEGTRIMSKMDPQATPSSLAVLEAETQAGRAEGTSVSHRFLVLFLLQRLHCTSCEMGLLYQEHPSCPCQALEVSLVIKLSGFLGLCYHPSCSCRPVGTHWPSR